MLRSFPEVLKRFWVTKLVQSKFTLHTGSIRFILTVQPFILFVLLVFIPPQPAGNPLLPPAEPMTGFELIPVDGGDPVHLPSGETVIGRGPFLNTHVNPCFIQSSLNSDARPLEKGSWHQLHHGDLFSLLPGRFIYRVEAVGREKCAHRNSKNFKEQKEPVSAGPDVEQKHTSSPSALSRDKSDSFSFQREESTQNPDDQSSIAPPPPRRRVLPMWMMAAVIKIQPALKTSKAVASPATEAMPTCLPGEVELHEEEEEEEKPGKNRRKMHKEETFKPEADVAPQESPVRAQRKRSRSEVGDESDNMTKKTGTSSSKMSQISQSANEEKKSFKVRIRIPCPYGKDCYRKNMFHFQECSHPGDTDYEEQEETDQPECPFGTDCYRKNPLHRKQFKHTKKPVCLTQNIAQNPPEDDEDSVDEDSFINDDSGAGEDDSDYVHLASDDSEREDVQRLQREAKAFLKTTK